MRQPLRGRLARLTAAAGLTAALVLPAAVPVTAADPVVLRVGTIEDLRSLNPYQSAYFPDYEAFQLNYQLLVDFGPMLEPIPGFADTWERSTDGKSWKFHIPAGMKWSDGTPATSADACFSYGLNVDALAKDTGVGNDYITPSLGDARVTKVECPDAETMILYTDDGTTKILKTYIPILPKHIYGKETYESIGVAEFKPPMVGTGQYQVAAYTEGQVVHLKRNPNYFLKQKGFADEVFIQIFKNADTMVQALKNGDIDYARAIPVEQFDRLKTEPNITTVAGKSNGWVELGFNSYGTGTGKTIPKGGPSTKALQDQKFRDALGYAIDKPELLERVIGGYGDVATTNVPPVLINTEATPPFQWHTEPTNPRVYDIDVAKQKLLDAGYRLNDQGQRLDKENKVISLKLVMPDTSPTYPQIAQFIEAWFSLLGIKVTSSVVEVNTLYDVMLPPEADYDDNHYTADYDLFVWSWYGGPDPNVLLQITLCDQIGSSSDSNWCDPAYDKLYADQNVATDDKARKAIIDQIQNMFYEQAPYHLIYYDDELDAYRTDRFAGWQNQPLDTGVPLLTYSVIGYSFLTDAKAPPTPAPSQAAAAPSAGTSAAPSNAAPAPSPSGGTGGGSAAGSESNTTLLLVGGALVVAGVVAAAIVARRRRSATEEE